MNKDLQIKTDRLVRSMQKSVKKVKEKNAIEDVLDSDNIAEMDADSVPGNTSSVLGKDEDKNKKKKKSKEKLVGGDADGMSDKDFDNKDLKTGTEVEKEHTSNKKAAKEVAKDHLESTDKYYESDGKAAGKEMSEDVKEAKKKILKGEGFVKDIMKSFEKISKAYMEKMGKDEADADNAEIGHATKNPKKMSNATNATFGSSLKGKPGSLKGHKGDRSPGQVEGERAAKQRRKKIKAQE